MRDAQPKSIYLKDYQPPVYVIDQTHLKFDLYEEMTLVESELLMRRNPEYDQQKDTSLELVGSSWNCSVFGLMIRN